MISVVMAAGGDAEALAGALGDLVPAAVDGLVIEVVLDRTGANETELAVAEDAGARLADGGLAGAAALARGAWLLFLPPQPVLDANWRRPVAEHVERRAGIVGLLKVERRAFWSATGAVLAPRARYEQAGGASTIAALARRLGGPSRTLRVLLSDRGWRL
jgi:hypothetical protein